MFRGVVLSDIVTSYLDFFTASNLPVFFVFDLEKILL